MPNLQGFSLVASFTRVGSGQGDPTRLCRAFYWSDNFSLVGPGPDDPIPPDP